jgi:hypothetical protein
MPVGNRSVALRSLLTWQWNETFTRSEERRMPSRLKPIESDGVPMSVPGTGEILKTIESARFVTGVSWVDGELWHATWENDESELRRVEPATGAVLEHLEMPAGMGISGLESDGGDTFFCGGGKSGKVRAVKRPRRRWISRRPLVAVEHFTHLARERARRDRLL